MELYLVRHGQSANNLRKQAPAQNQRTSLAATAPDPRTGCRGFSRAYDRLLAERIYRSGTVDAVLQDCAVEVCDATLGRFMLPPDVGANDVTVLRGRRPVLAHFADFAVRVYRADCKVLSIARFCSEIEARFPSPEHSARGGYYASPDHFMWGGTEEFVIAKGSDWCAELARVFCALCEMIGVPARIVFALDGSDDGHVLAECYGCGSFRTICMFNSRNDLA